MAVLVHTWGCAATAYLPVQDAVAEASWRVKRGANLADREAHPSQAILDTRLALARALLADGEYDAAMAQLAWLQRAEPSWFSFRLLYAETAYAIGGDLSHALREVDACLALSERVAGCWALRGDILRDLDRPAEAAQAYARAIALGDADPGLPERQARALLSAGDAAAAWELLRPRMWGAPSVPTMLLGAQVAEAAGDPEEAEALLLRATDAFDDPIRGLRLLQALYLRTGDAAAADAVEAQIRRTLAERVPTRGMRPLPRSTR